MNYLKKTVSIMLMVIMVLSLAACGKDNNADVNPSDTVEKSPLYQKDQRIINIGTWYDQYYTSEHTDISDNPKVDNQEEAEMQLKNVRAIEKKYNVLFYYQNLTWDGIIEAINTTIMAGTPECDVFQSDVQFGIPAVLNNYAIALEDILNDSEEAKAGKIGEQYKKILSEEGDYAVTKLQFTTDNKTYLFAQNGINTNAYALGYNKELISKNGLTDPYDLYINNNWTWDEWLNMMITINQDTDGDGNTDQWGFRGAWTVLLNQLLMSNGACIAGVKPDDDGVVREKITDEKTTEVLNFFSDLYQKHKLSFWTSDCDNDWNDNVYAWAKGNIGFWVDALWIAQEADKDQNMMKTRGIVNWPVGPHGDAKTNASQNAQGNWFFIPVGTENPALVYCVMRDYFDWYKGDLEHRDNLEWAEQWSYNDQNLEVFKSMGDDSGDFTTDLWQSGLKFAKMTDENGYEQEIGPRQLIETGAEAATVTVSEFQQANKQVVQDYLDTNFKK